MDALLPANADLAVETLFSRLDVGAAPTHHVAALGPPVYEWEPPARALAGASTSTRLAPDPYAIIWQLLDNSRLLVQLVELSEESEEATGGTHGGTHAHADSAPRARPATAAVLQFGAPLLPSISAIHREAGVTVAVLSADGALHTVTLDPGAVRGRSLAQALAAPGTVASTLLGPQLARLGAPTALAHLPSHVCVGTEEGNVLCLPSDSLAPAAALELWASGALSKVLGAVFGGRAPQGVAHLLEVEVPGSSDRLLAAVHANGGLRLWELSSRKLLHQGDLVIPAQQATHAPALARLSSELLDSGEALLLLYLEPRADLAAPGELHSFQARLPAPAPRQTAAAPARLALRLPWHDAGTCPWMLARRCRCWSPPFACRLLKQPPLCRSTWSRGAGRTTRC